MILYVKIRLPTYSIRKRPRCTRIGKNRQEKIPVYVCLCYDTVFSS